MVNKIRLFLDIDNTIINTIKAYCDVYNDLYQFRPGFKEAIWYNVEKYDMKDECPLILNKNDIFGSYDFFQKCEFMNDNTYEVIEKLNEKYQVFICTLGIPKNLSYKALWLEKNLPFINDYLLLNNGNCKMNKSIIDMSSNSIFIDDVTSNLDTSNAAYKIIFGDEYEWSQTKNYIRCFNWIDVEKLLL
jgi:5'(3')-deoxyribonucleotidase